MAAQPNTFSALGRALVQQGRLVQADANAIQMEATKEGISFIQKLVQTKKLSAKDVSQFAAQTFGYPLLDLNAGRHRPPAAQPDRQQAGDEPPRDRARQARQPRCSSPCRTRPTSRSCRKVKFATGLNMEPVVVEDDKLEKIVKKLSDSSGKALEMATDEVDLSGIEVTDGERSSPISPPRTSTTRRWSST
jgi:type IV pilus assembly protein PilB